MTSPDASAASMAPSAEDRGTSARNDVRSDGRGTGGGARLWSLGWAVLVAAGAGLALALFADANPVWITALAIGGLPGLLGALWRPTGLARLALIGLWATAVASAAVLTGGVGGPLSPWCLMPLLVALTLGGGVLDGVLFSGLALAIAGVIGTAAQPPAPHGNVLLLFAVIGAGSLLLAAMGAITVARRGSVAQVRDRESEVAELQVLLGDLPHLAVALDRNDGVFAVFGQPLAVMSHDSLYGGLAAAAATDTDRDRIRAALGEALDHGDSEVSFAPETDPSHRISAALRRTASGGLVAVLRDTTGEAARGASSGMPATTAPDTAIGPGPVSAHAYGAAAARVASPFAAPASVPVPAAPAPADETRLLSLTARLAETQVKAKEADQARTRAEEELQAMRDSLLALETQLKAAHAAHATLEAQRESQARAVPTPVFAPPAALPASAETEGRIAALTAQVAALEASRAEAEARGVKAEETLQARSRFLANMSHELRTPLNAIMGFSEIMRARMFGELTPKYGEYAELIHESGRHLMDLISDVLDMSKIEAERFQLDREMFDAREAVSAALRLMRVQAEEVGVNLRGVMPGQPIPVDADRRALKQITLNLVSNALKFTPRTGHVTVTTHAVGGLLEITVADTGIGIDPSDLKRLGRPFEQAGASGDRARGTGLGLSLVKAFAQLHGGDMSIESQLGEGTAVLVRLPVLAPTPAEGPRPDGTTEAASPAAHRPASVTEPAPANAEYGNPRVVRMAGRGTAPSDRGAA